MHGFQYPTFRRLCPWRQPGNVDSGAAMLLPIGWPGRWVCVKITGSEIPLQIVNATQIGIDSGFEKET